MPLNKADRTKRLRVRLTLILAGAAACGALTYLLLAPGGMGKSAANYKFMHCDVCGMERAYDPALANQRCMRCRPPKTGVFVPTEKSMAAGGSMNPWRNFYVAIAIETVALLGTLAFTLRPQKDEEKEPNLLCNCPHCEWRLRFRESLAGKVGKCPRCKKVFRFPEDAPVEEPEEVG